MIADTDTDKCNAFIDFLLIYLRKKMNSMKIISHLNLVILLYLMLLLKGEMSMKN